MSGASPAGQQVVELLDLGPARHRLEGDFDVQVPKYAFLDPVGIIVVLGGGPAAVQTAVENLDGDLPGLDKLAVDDLTFGKDARQGRKEHEHHESRKQDGQCLFHDIPPILLIYS